MSTWDRRSTLAQLISVGCLPVAIALCFLSLACDRAFAESIEFEFRLDRQSKTSAGVFRLDGTLIRTLWNAETHGEGNHVAWWDGKDDRGLDVPSSEYHIRLLAHNISYEWEGVIGNSSKSFTDNVWRSFVPIQSLAAGTDSIYGATGYNEQQPGFVKFLRSDPQSRHSIFRGDPFTSFGLVAKDKDRTYWATDGHGVQDKQACFVIALNAIDDLPYPFPAGQDVEVRNHDNQRYRGAIDVSMGSVDQVATGLAVQSRGRILAVAHGNQDQIKLFDKNTGSLLGTIEDVPLRDFGEYAHAEDRAGESQLAMDAVGDLWVLCDTSARRYTDLTNSPTIVATISGLSRGRAIAAHPNDPDVILVADGGRSQQIKAFDQTGRLLWTHGQVGGYDDSPVVTDDKFRLSSALCVLDDGSFWLVDELNFRALHFSSSRELVESIAYLPHQYVATVDLNDPTRVFVGYLEFEVDYAKPLLPGSESWSLKHNWGAGLRRDETTAGWNGLRMVVTLANGRTYGIDKQKQLVELPPNKKLRQAGMRIDGVLYDDGSLRYSRRADGRQTVYQRELKGFDQYHNPIWGDEEVVASMPDSAGDPTHKGAFTGVVPIRFPVTQSGVVVSFDASVKGNEGFHLGGVRAGSRQWLWRASPTGWTNGKGNFQTHAIDGSVNYGGNNVWSCGRHIVVGYHGEFWRSSPQSHPGQANKFMHFRDDGLFIGEFGVGSEYKDNGGTEESPPGLAGNSFSPVLIEAEGKLFLWHNDEFYHAGLHRWRIDGVDTITELTGTIRLGTQPSVRLESKVSSSMPVED